MTTLAVAGAASAATPAEAQLIAKPKLTFTLLASGIEAGNSQLAAYSAVNVPTGDTVDVQRLVGNPGHFRTIKTVGKNRSHVKDALWLTPPGQGRWSYRLAIIGTHKKLIASKTAVLYAYRTEPLAQISGQPSGTVQVGQQLFDYVMRGNGYAAGPTGVMTLQTGSTCRYISLSIASPDGTAEVSVLQADADAVNVTVPIGTVGAIQTPLHGNSWEIDYTFDADKLPYVGKWVYANGTADCWTSSGR